MRNQQLKPVTRRPRASRPCRSFSPAARWQGEAQKRDPEVARFLTRLGAQFCEVSLIAPHHPLLELRAHVPSPRRKILHFD